MPSGSTQEFIGALVFMMTGFGLGWVNAAADYSRYLPKRLLQPLRDRLDHVRRVGGPAGPAAVRPAAGRLVHRLNKAIGADPIGALTTILPTWFLVPFAIVAVLGLVGGAVLDIYSSGLSLLAAGVRVPRYAAAGSTAC
jgi:NCS1 family nucleobase:cation symporter-1